jgi:putative superfamily III holin-X
MSGRSLPQVVKETMEDARRLVQLEVQLVRDGVKTGVQAKAKYAVAGTGGALFLYFGMLFLLAAAAAGLAIVLPWWLALLIVAGAAIGLGALLAGVAVAGLKRGPGLIPPETVAKVREDGEWLLTQRS